MLLLLVLIEQLRISENLVNRLVGSAPVRVQNPAQTFADFTLLVFVPIVPAQMVFVIEVLVLAELTLGVFFLSVHE